MDQPLVAAPIVGSVASPRVVKPIVAIREYFFDKAPAQEVLAGMRGLTAEDKAELAAGAAAALGVTLSAE